MLYFRNLSLKSGQCATPGLAAVVNLQLRCCSPLRQFPRGSKGSVPPSIGPLYKGGHEGGTPTLPLEPLGKRRDGRFEPVMQRHAFHQLFNNPLFISYISAARRNDTNGTPAPIDTLMGNSA